MKAAVVTRYGPPEVVELRDRPDPRPRPGEVMIRVHSSTVTAADWRMRSGTVPRGFGPLIRLALGWRGPRQAVLGVEMAGEVLALGEGVTRFALGDRVFAMTGVRMGGHAERAVLKELRLSTKSGPPVIPKSGPPAVDGRSFLISSRTR